MERIKLYFKESYHELMTKVSWPSWIELQESALVVSIFIIIFSIIIFLMDFSSESLISKLFYGLFK